MTRKLHDILEKIITTSSSEALWKNVVEYTKEMGAAQIHTWFGQTNEELVCYSTIPEWWQEYFVEINAIEYDYLTTHAARGNGPLLYGCDKDLHNPTLCQKARDLIKMSTAEFHYGCGITLPSFHNNQRIGGINVCFPETVSELNNVSTQRILELLLVSSTAHERLFILRSQEEQPALLTPRQQECLTWLALGLTSQEVATKIGISLHTVKMHIDSAKERLGATTRIQAVAKALSTGLITVS